MDKRPLSEISHLFLSNVRDLAKPGAPRPQRIPPGGPRIESTAAKIPPASSVDLTPEEFAEVFAKLDLDEDRPAKKPTVTAVLASHLAGSQTDRVKAYARHYAAAMGGQIGMIEVDAHEFRLWTFEPGIESHVTTEEIAPEGFDARTMSDTLGEMAADIDFWLLLVLNPRLPESRNLLRSVNHWVLLSTCDHDGVVACYRTVKGLADLHTPRLSLAVLDARTEAEASVIHRKLAGVCQQFLSLPLQQDAMVEPATSVAESLVLHCRPVHDKAQLASGSQWQVVSEFLANASSDRANENHEDVMPQDVAAQEAPIDQDRVVEDLPHLNPFAAHPKSEPVMPEFETPAPLQIAKPAFDGAQARQATVADDDASDVVDLPSADASPASILSAVVRHSGSAMIECPIRPPMCPEATLAVTRDRGLVLLAVAGQGLTDLRLIGQAYQWLNQNRQLISMAMPQFAIEAHRLPSLRLLVDHKDMSADLLQPMLEAKHVSVQAYRKLRWGSKSGLLLEAA